MTKGRSLPALPRIASGLLLALGSLAVVPGPAVAAQEAGAAPAAGPAQVAAAAPAAGLGTLTGVSPSVAAGPLSHYLVAWGDDTVGQTEVPDGLSDVVAVSAGYNHGLALREGGTVVGWGANGSGQIDIPAGLTGVTGVSAGYLFSVALQSNGTVVAWGDPAYGETVVPAGLTTVTAIAAGNNHVLALKSDKTVVAWGLNDDGETVVPVGLTNVIAIAAGNNFSLALKGDGTVVAWGHDTHGETDVSGLVGVAAISAGAHHGLALELDGTVVAWGDDSRGQTDIPTDLSNPTAISAGGFHNLARKSDGTVAAWGDDHYLQSDVPVGLKHAVAVSAGSNSSVALTQPPTLELTGLSSPRIAETGGTLTVTVKNHEGGVGTGYRGTVHFTSTDATAILPADYTFTGSDSGVHDFSVTLRNAGTHSVTATDIENGLVAGSQSGIVVTYAATTYHAIAPARVLDTRTSGAYWTNIGLTGPFVAGTVRTFHVANAHYVGGGSAVAVPANATAVTGNLTVVDETASGVVALGPTMTATGEVTTINFVKGDVRANNVTVGLAPDGTLQAVFRSSTSIASTALILDVTGYFLPEPGPGGATYHAVSPGRVLDTRPTSMGWTNIGLTSKFRSKVVRTFSVAGVKGLGWTSPQVPVGATAVTGNVTVTNATYNGFLSLGPTLASVPKTSTVNIKMGNNCANGVTVALNGRSLQAVWVGGIGSTADVIFDVTGYFTADASGLSYYPIVPIRLLDSSTGKGLSGVFSAGVARTLTVGGVGGEGGIPSDAAGISGNLTLVNPSANGWAQVAPAISGIPTSSTVNAVAHQTVANGFDVALDGSGQVMLVWVGASGSAHLQLDVTGYWK